MNKLRKELVILRELGIKVNYADLARKYNCEGYDGKSKTRSRDSKLNKYKEEISEKINIPGSNINATYQYIKSKYNGIGCYSNFRYYVRKEGLKKDICQNTPHPRYETEYGKQLQFDWKESITMENKYGEIFEFNIFSAILSFSRFHSFIYSKNKTREDVERCLIQTFKHIQGLPEEILTDNMSSKKEETIVSSKV